jgi:hypothetical protein
MSRTALVILNSLTLIMVISGNTLVGSGKLSEKTVGEISRKYDTLITPAGYAFSIWAIIYLLLTGFIIYQWVALMTNKNRNIIDRTGIFLIISNFANIGWLFLWLNEYIGYSVLAMLILLLSLIVLVIRLRLEIWDAPVRIILFVWWPVVIYLGWIIIAMVANVAAFLTSLTWDGSPLSSGIWTIVLILIATGIYTFLLFTRNLRESALVGVWAFVAIAVKQGTTHLGTTVTACAAAILLLAETAYHGYRNRKTSPLEKMKRGEF